MTEEQLKTKWCPLYRVDGNKDRVYKCIGSECAMHRSRVVTMWKVGKGSHEVDEHYCGLAGLTVVLSTVE
jgi:hypothetical protein